jgi:hypothetical protein
MGGRILLNSETGLRPISLKQQQQQQKKKKKNSHYLFL